MGKSEMKETMNIRIEKGDIEFLNDCKEALVNSELGRRYFKNGSGAEEAIREGLEQGGLYVALDGEICVGFIWYIPKGAFHAFSYLHIIAVKSEYRGNGIGTKLITFLEELVFEKTSKVFLVVADFNPKGKKLYEKLGYNKVGEIPSLYREGVTEYLMMKEKSDN